MRHFESPERRKMPRRTLFVDGVISFAGGTRMRCFVQNVSQTGATVAFATVTDLPAVFTLCSYHLHRETEYVSRARWRNSRSVGVEFGEP
jgi:hypothetical protein